MLNIFENSWFLLTTAGIALVAAGIVRQAKPEWGFKPMLVPLALAGLAFGLDAAVMTDYEAVGQIITACKRAVVQQDASGIMRFVSPNYADSIHRDKAALSEAAECILKKAAVNKIRIQSHAITMNGTSAASKLAAAVHLNPDNQYTSGTTLVFVSLDFDYEKIGKTWYIRRAEVTSINYTPMDWGDVR